MRYLDRETQSKIVGASFLGAFVVVQYLLEVQISVESLMIAGGVFVFFMVVNSVYRIYGRGFVEKRYDITLTLFWYDITCILPIRMYFDGNKPIQVLDLFIIGFLCMALVTIFVVIEIGYNKFVD